MSANYVLLEKITVGAGSGTGVSSVTFSSIPQTGYTDLVLVSSARSATSSGNWDGVYVSFNGTSITTNHSARRMYGFSTLALSDSSLPYANIIPSNSVTASTFGNASMYIPNYTGSNNKSISVDAVTENNSSSGAIAFLTAGLWSNTAAITSITLTTESGGNFVPNSTFYLYGVAKLGTTPAIVPYATGGDTIMTDGTYWYHTFISSGTFTPQKSITCDYLVVAGGGSGASGTTVSRRGGAGGAGGYRTSIGGTPLSLITQAYTVTVGAGAAASSSVRTPGTQGSNSVFSTITSTGGGFGSTPDTPPGNGGSGGGGGDGAGPGEIGPGTGNTPSTSPSQGNNGGAGQSTNGQGAGTGGGATAAGITSTSSAGGAGASNSISGSSVTYSTGGPVISSGAGSNATANTGNGGSGGGPNDLAGNGGSGIVIVRYAV